MTLSGASPPAAGERAGILVVDDRPDKLAAFKLVLEELGQDIVTATSGEQALKHILMRDFAVILLDVNMPGLDGLETARLIRNRRRSAHTPIIFVTADFHDEDLRRGYALGAVDYIGSPIVPEVLRAKVKVFVELSLLARQAARQAQHQVALAEERAARLAAEHSTQRQAYLAHASATLSGSLEVDATLQEIGRLLVPRVADFAVIALTGGPMSEAHPPRFISGDGRAGAANRLLGEALDPTITGLIGETAAAGVLRKLPAEGGEGSYPLPGGQSARSLVALPLAARGQAIAVMVVGMANRSLDAEALALAGEIAVRASTALDNSMLHHQIRDSDARKNEFLAMLAHELRNPLAPIANAVEVLRAGGRDEERVAWARELIGRQVTQLTRLVDDLLDLSRITRGKIDLKLGPVDAAEVVNAAVETCTPLAASRGHTIEIQRASEAIRIRGDFARMAQVLGNLVNNAAKYTDPGGRIDIGLARDGRDAVFSVRDSGMGIPADALASVFEPFTQLERTLDRAQGGLGIGLTLVRRLVEMQGGSVTAHSAGSGRGSEFVVRIPLLEEVATPDANPGTGATKRAGPVPGAAPGTVLVVDDNADVAQSTALYLRVVGYDVEIALDGCSALAAVDRVTPDAVLLDIGLPGMDGYQVAARMRERPECARTLIVAMSGYGQEEYLARSRLAGVDHHLVKPINLDAVVALLAQRSAASPPPHAV